MGGETEMNSVIVFFLSPDNDKLAKPIEYYVENNKTLSFKGIQSTDASIQYLLWKAAHDEDPVNKIITIVSNEVKEKTWENFQKRVKNWLSGEKLRKDYEGKNIEFLPIEYDETLDDTFKLAGNVYRQLSKYIFESDEKVSVYLDYTGGFRDVSFLMVTIMRYLEYHEVPCKEVVYAHWKEPTRICPMNNIYEMFKLLNGVDQFTRTGNADLLWQCYQKADNESIKKVLEKIVEFSQAMSLCDIKRIDKILPQLNEELAGYKESQFDNLFDGVFSDMVRLIRKKLGMENSKTLSYLQIISWCVNNNMLQQALTLYVQKIPEYYRQQGIFSQRIETITEKNFKIYKLNESPAFRKILQQLYTTQQMLSDVEVEQIEDLRLKAAYLRLQNFVKDHYSDDGKKITEGALKLYGQSQAGDIKAVETETKNKWKFIKEVNDDWTKIHYFYYNNEEEYYNCRRIKMHLKNFYSLKGIKYTDSENFSIPKDMAVDILKYYFVIKLIRNQINHASMGEGLKVDDNRAMQLYKAEYHFKMDGFKNIKEILKKGIALSEEAVNIHNKKEREKKQ